MKWRLNWKMGKPPERTEHQKHYDMVMRNRRSGPGRERLDAMLQAAPKCICAGCHGMADPFWCRSRRVIVDEGGRCFDRRDGTIHVWAETPVDEADGVLDGTGVVCGEVPGAGGQEGVSEGLHPGGR